MINPKFHKLLNKMAEVHDRKNHDYAYGGNPYSNFEEAAATAGLGVDTVFAVLIGIKLSRLNALTKEGKEPNNESIQDTREDLAVYSALWASYYEKAEDVEYVVDPDGNLIPVNRVQGHD
jgi:hypothetical protein